MDRVKCIRWDIRIMNVNTDISFDFTIWQEKYDIMTLVEFFEKAYPHHVITMMKHTPFKE